MSLDVRVFFKSNDCRNPVGFNNKSASAGMSLDVGLF